MTPEQAHLLIEKDSRNTEVLFPYLNGEDLTQSPTQQASRWVINFFDWPEERARQYSDCFTIVENIVKPQRSKSNYENFARYWWHHANRRPNLHEAIAKLDRMLTISCVSKAIMPSFVPTGQVLAHPNVAFAYDDDFHLGALSSGFHFRWVVRHASSLRDWTRYSPSDVFETFVQPSYSEDVSHAAHALDKFRRNLMVSEWIGLTTLYNRIHDPTNQDQPIRQMRALHRDLDHAVQEAYGWNDLDLDHGFHTVRGAGVRYTFAPETADEILDRLLELNRDRYQAEVAEGLHRNRSSAPRTELGGLFATPEEPPEDTTNPNPEDSA